MHLKNVTGFLINFYCNNKRFIHFVQIFYIYLLLVTRSLFEAVYLRSLALHQTAPYHTRVYFVIFSVGGIPKNFMTGPSGNSGFCFPSTLDGNKTHCSPRDQSLRCLSTVFSGPYQTFSFGPLANFPDLNRCEIYTRYWNWIEV